MPVKMRMKKIADQRFQDFVDRLSTSTGRWCRHGCCNQLAALSIVSGSVQSGIVALKRLGSYRTSPANKHCVSPRHDAFFSSR
jgi:hypothetical protein